MILRQLGKRSLTSAIVLLTMIGGSAGTVLASEMAGFVVPGVDFSRLSLKKGAWCRYLVVDEALGTVDSTEVYVGVPDGRKTPEGTAFWIEIQTRLYGQGIDDTEVMKLLVLEGITDFSPGDSLGDYVLELYIKSGERPVQEEDPKAFKDFSLVIPATDSSWVSVNDVTLGTSAGDFGCTKKTRQENNDKEIPTGGVTLVKKARDDYAVWFCDDVPIFHMARCVIERIRQTETRPPISGIPSSQSKDSKTTAELTAFGYDAQPLLTVGSRQE